MRKKGSVDIPNPAPPQRDKEREPAVSSARPRLLIAGCDLKFIKPLIPYLEKEYEVRVDEWAGHTDHDEQRSAAYAKWADIIWCEWLLGNAVYYSKLKKENQRLVIRGHRFETTSRFGYQVDFSKVDMFFAVGYYYYELFQKTFRIPREKMRLLSNYVEGSIYSMEKDDCARYRVGLVGFIPDRKNLHHALQIIRELRYADHRFRLCLVGQEPRQVSWVHNDPKQREYFNKCDKYILENNLEEYVIYLGFLERSQIYNSLGYVLSLSNSESFHLALAEGAFAGCMGMVLKEWKGSEYLYPERCLYNSTWDIIGDIVRAGRDDQFYRENVGSLHNFVERNYNIGNFLNNLHRYLKQLFI